MGFRAEASGDTLSVQQVDNVNASIRYYDLTPKALVTTFTSGSATNTFLGVAQKIENGTKLLSGYTITISFKIYSVIPRDISIEYRQNFGVGGSPVSNGLNQSPNISLAAGWNTVEYTHTLPVLTNQTITDSNALWAIIWLSTGSAQPINLGIQPDGAIQLSAVQVVMGANAKPFIYTPIGETLTLCQRYYEKSYNQSTFAGDATTIGATYLAAQVTATGTWAVPTYFKVPKRVDPAVETYSAVTGAINTISVGNVDVPRTILQPSQTGFIAYADPVVLANVGSAIQFNWTADAEL